MPEFLKTKGTQIVLPDGRPVILNGVNLGGWLMKEAYFLHAPNFPEQWFKKKFTKELGDRAWNDFNRSYYDSFIAESDIKNIASLGFNCIRVPFHYGLIEKKAYDYDMKGVKYLDNVIKWAEKYKLCVMLDMHAAPGSQNHDWHSDSDGRAMLWTTKSYQRRAYKLWEFLADRCKDNPAVVGYDLLNEPNVPKMDVLNNYYKGLIKHIRKVDKNHILFIEGDVWSTVYKGLLEDIEDNNYVLSIHSYEPLNFTFNFVPFLKYPLKDHDRRKIVRHHEQYEEIAKRRKCPIHVGEFGVNYREGIYGEDQWLKDVLTCFEDMNFHWNYWTYKAVKNYAFPDGVYSYYENPPWVNRPGPKQGWNTYHLHWKKHKKDMIKSWKTESFKENTLVMNILTDAAHKNNKSLK